MVGLDPTIFVQWEQGPKVKPWDDVDGWVRGRSAMPLKQCHLPAITADIRAFQFQQEFLGFDPAAEAGQLPGRAAHPDQGQCGRRLLRAGTARRFLSAGMAIR